jgi:hypothetical protein
MAWHAVACDERDCNRAVAWRESLRDGGAGSRSNYAVGALALTARR